MRITTVPVPGYEKVVQAEDENTGLRAYIAVHSTALGPALGGMRMWPFKTADEALTDVLRLAKGMTYKSAVADTGLGGGKSVIVGDPRKEKTPALVRAMGKFVDSLDGLYITAEDVGTTTEDMVEIAGVTRWVTGLPREKGGSGNPAPSTALGTFLGLKATVEERLGRQNLKGLTIAVQGLGQVGFRFAEMLHSEGAKLIVADIARERVDDAVRRFAAVACTDEEIFGAACDVFAPCALGGILNDGTIPKLRCAVVAGCANNQLLESRHGDDLQKRGVLYAPDFVINAGGIINVSLELEPGGYDPEKARRKIQNIPRALKQIYQLGKREKIATHAAADRLAEERLQAKKKVLSPVTGTGHRGGKS